MRTSPHHRPHQVFAAPTSQTLPSSFRAPFEKRLSHSCHYRSYEFAHGPRLGWRPEDRQRKANLEPTPALPPRRPAFLVWGYHDIHGITSSPPTAVPFSSPFPLLPST